MTKLLGIRRTLLLPLCGLLCAFAPALALVTPTHFKVVADPTRDSVTLTWKSSAPQIRFSIQKQLPSGVWSEVSGFPVNHINTHSFYYNTPSTVTGTFRFRIRAKQGSTYSPWTEPWIVRTNMH